MAFRVIQLNPDLVDETLLEETDNLSVCPKDLGHLSVNIWRVKHVRRRTTNADQKRAYEKWQRDLGAFEAAQKENVSLRTRKAGREGPKAQKFHHSEYKGFSWAEEMFEVPRVDRVDPESYKKDGITHKIGYLYSRFLTCSVF